MHDPQSRPATVNQARALRRHATLAERTLWRLLRDRRLNGLKFRRQLPIGPYVVDFVCLAHRLVVEADSPFHDPGHDARRDLSAVWSYPTRVPPTQRKPRQRLRQRGLSVSSLTPEPRRARLEASAL